MFTWSPLHLFQALSYQVEFDANFLISHLSGGMKRRLSLAIAFVGNMSLIFLDEPSTGLDPEHKRQI